MFSELTVFGREKLRTNEPLGAFDPEVVILFDVLLEFPLSSDRQRIVCNADVNVLVLKIRQLGLYDQFILGFVDVYGWRPRC
jgi:hypothetical protein